MQSGISVTAIHRRHCNVKSLPSRDEMDLKLSALFREFKYTFQEALDGFANRTFLVVGEKSMTVKLDKNPFRPSQDPDACLAPVVEPGKGKRVIPRQSPIINARHWHTVNLAPPI